MKLIKLIKAGIGFLSSIPVGISMDEIEVLMKRIYLYPFIGTILGLFNCISCFISYLLFPPQFGSALIICSIYFITFFNHLDGLSDFGDGIVAHGSIEKKRKALKDTIVGTGGVSFICIYILVLYCSLFSLNSISTLFFINFFQQKMILFFGPFSNIFCLNSLFFVCIVVLLSEVAAKQSMLTIASFGISFNSGLGSMTINGAKSNKLNVYIGMAYSIFVSSFLLGIIGILCLFASICSSFYILFLSNKHFNGLNGDGIGVSNEFGRVIFIIFVIFILKMIVIGDNIWML